MFCFNRVPYPSQKNRTLIGLLWSVRQEPFSHKRVEESSCSYYQILRSTTPYPIVYAPLMAHVLTPANENLPLVLSFRTFR